jgi:hypothetical protein
MNFKAIAMTVIMLPVLAAPTMAQAFVGPHFPPGGGLGPVGFGPGPHFGHGFFGFHDAVGLAHAMGYHRLDVKPGFHGGFIVTGFNDDGKWLIFISGHGHVDKVKFLGGGHGHSDGDDGDDDGDNGGHGNHGQANNGGHNNGNQANAGDDDDDGDDGDDGDD